MAEISTDDIAALYQLALRATIPASQAIPIGALFQRVDAALNSASAPVAGGVVGLPEEANPNLLRGGTIIRGAPGALKHDIMRGGSSTPSAAVMAGED